MIVLWRLLAPRAAAASHGIVFVRRAWSVGAGGGCSAMAIGDAAPHGGTFFFFRSEMDPLNTLWKLPSVPRMLARRCFDTTRAAARDMREDR